LKERYEDYKFIYNEIKSQKPIYRRDVKWFYHHHS
jgi:hypothetical protein